MKLHYYGHSCFSLRFADGTLLVTDPFDASVPYVPCSEIPTAVLVSHDHFDHNCTSSLRGDFKIVRSAGEYRFGDVRVAAVDSFHDDQRGALRGSNLITRIDGDGLRIAHLGDLGHMPETQAQREALTDLDVMLIPVGGCFTIDTPTAEEIIRTFRPGLAVAMHYRTEVIADWKISTEERFVRDMHAFHLPDEADITADSLPKVPSAAVMAYK